ncbi:MAG: bifunctional diguanylate cyclase/phosphodiesterase, partial [Alphaproteobacteria bacterium]
MENKKASLVGSLFKSSSAHIWKSRISWRIITAVFLTILTIQAIILSVTLKQFEEKHLNHLKQIGRSAIAPLIDTSNADFLTSPFTDADINRLFSTTIVSGIAVYSNQLDMIKSYGAQMALVVFDIESLGKTYRGADGSTYEVVYKSSDLGRPYIIVARLDSSKIRNQMMEYVEQTILIMLLMSAFVTTVLMIALSKWLLEPILFMRGNLIAASKDPENPKIQSSPFNPNDEIGGAIEIAQQLINQNADNLRRIKSTAEDKIHRLAY